jgi:hypothetical protein
MKAYITRFALTNGIEEVDGKVADTQPTMFVYRTEESRLANMYAHGNDWHKTYEAAVARAEVMRSKKIASLKKSLAKLEALVF